MYGDIVYKCWKEQIKEKNPDIDEENLNKETFLNLHRNILEGFDSVKETIKNYLNNHWNIEDGEKTEENVTKK